jgi:hypothetical protein
MPHLTISRNDGSSLRAVFQLTQEYKLIEVMSNGQMPICQESKWRNRVGKSTCHSQCPESMREWKVTEAIYNSQMQIRQDAQILVGLPISVPVSSEP